MTKQSQSALHLHDTGQFGRPTSQLAMLNKPRGQHAQQASQDIHCVKSTSQWSKSHMKEAYLWQAELAGCRVLNVAEALLPL